MSRRVKVASQDGLREGDGAGLLDEVEFLQNHLGLLDLDEVSEELPQEEQKSISTPQTALTALQMASRKAVAFSFSQGAAFSRSQVSASQHHCWRLCRIPWSRCRALAQMLSSGFWPSRRAETEGLWILRRTPCRASGRKGLDSSRHFCMDGGLSGTCLGRGRPWS